MAIELIVKRYFPVVVLVLVATAAYFQARGAVQLIALGLNRGDASGNERSRRNAGAAAGESKTGHTILERNPFDSVTGTLGGEQPFGLGSTPKPGMSSADPLSWPVCEGVQVLIVTESTDPWWSLTTLQGPGEARPRLRRVGDGVAGKQVAFIGFNPKQQAPAVWLEGSGAFCQCMLFQRQPESAGPAQSRLAAAPVMDFNVDRSLIAKGLADPISVMGPVRMVPERKDGKLIGLRLFGIRAGTLPGLLGLQNGDRLESINGFNVASPEQALEAYARLRAATRLFVRVKRRVATKGDQGAERSLELNLNIN
jgi:general secretion pathway protein C